MAGNYNLWLVALSLVIATLASYAALDMSSRVSQAINAKTGLLWLLGGSITMGTGIWSMHFVGMLAFKMNTPVSYDLGLTVLSLLFALALSSFALWLVSSKSMTWRSVMAGGIAMGSGICAMHYTGMEAMQMAHSFSYDPFWVFLSIIIAIVAAMAALWFCFALSDNSNRVFYFDRPLASIIMGCAIAGMHYTGMAAVIEGDAFATMLSAENENTFLFSNESLAIAVSVAIGQLLLGSFIISAIQSAKSRELESALKIAESATLSKANFLANMSHEIRTPLNAVLGFAGLLNETELNTTQREFILAIQQSGDHLLGVINDILDFSKLNAKGLTLEIAPFDLARTIEASLSFVAQAAGDKNLELIYTVGEGVPLGLEADDARIRQILVNLLSNAVKFTDSGEVVLSVESVPRHGEGQHSEDNTHEHEFQFSVKDTGIGLKPNEIEVLFQQFSQVDASTARIYGGTGLGLAICRALVELHGGKIWVDSTDGVGSTFHFTIPAREHPIRFPPNEAKSQKFLKGKRIFLVDDNATNLRVLSKLLQSWEMSVTATHSPHEALSWLSMGDQFDLIVVDHHMPGISGIELAAHVRQQAHLNNAKLVLLTSVSASLRYPTELFSSALVKPVKQSELYNELASVLDGELYTTKVTHSTAYKQLPPMSILLAEDAPVNQLVAITILQKLGLSADIAANGLEVLTAVQKHRYDVILMDVQMPRMDGLEATRQIRAKGSAIHQPKIIALTANAMSEDRDICLAAGMDSYIPKPIDITQLTEHLLRFSPSANTLPSREINLKYKQLFGEEEFVSLLELSKSSLADISRELQSALSAEDLNRIAWEAHKLISSTMHIGQPSLSTLFREIEQKCNEGQDAQTICELVKQAIPRLTVLINDIEQELIK